MIRRLTLSLLLVISVIGVAPLGASAKWKEDAHKNRSWVENGVTSKGWKQIDGNWYYFGNDGIMTTGWMMDNGSWYYFWSDGTMAHSSWLTNGGFWYYFDENGKMISDSKVIENRKYDFTPAFIISENTNNTAVQADSNAKK